MLGDARTALGKVRDYTCTFTRQELRNGTLSAEQVAEMKVRSNPAGVYVRFAKPDNVAGMEVAYTAARRNQKMRYRPAGIAGGKGFQSLDLDDAKFLTDNRDALKCDVVVVSDTGMIAKHQPTISYGLRGVAALEVKVTGAKMDLHSGVFGGAVANPAAALARMLARVPVPSIVIGLVTVTVPNPPGSSASMMPPLAVLEIAPANVLHGAVRLHGLASSPTPETQVRVA